MDMKKNDIVRLNYEAKMKEGDQKIIEMKNSPVIVGAGYMIKGVDEALETMNVGDKKEIEISPDKGFGKRNLQMIKVIPETEFKKHGQRPAPGMFITADNLRGRVMSVSSGRVKVDFNHPLAGKTLIYNVEVSKQEDKNEDKIKAIAQFYSNTEPENISVTLNGKEAEVILPPAVHSVYKKKIADDTIKYVGLEKVKFVEVFSKTEEK